MPKLPYTKPPSSLLRELNEVAVDAKNLADALAKANGLPPTFPITQTQELLESLEALPSGTGEGCVKPLETALSRLPAIRKKYFETEEQSRRSQNSEEAPPPLTRGMLIDQRLGALVNSITTALDEYRALASVEADSATDTAPSLTIDANSWEVISAAETAKSAEHNITAATQEVERITQPDSTNADNLKRQMRDARGLLQLARVELRMPEFVLRWFRKIINTLQDYPGLLLATSKAVQIGVDVARPLAEAWHNFERGFTHLVLNSIEDAAKGLEEVAQKWDTPRKNERDHRIPPFSIIRDRLATSQLGPEMVVIPSGEFLMGSALEEINLPEDDRAYENEFCRNGKKRLMRISRNFAIGRYLVTNNEYFSYLTHTDRDRPDADQRKAGNHPAANVNWNDAQEYIAWLNEQTGKAYRLPSEAEWEYSCRAGTDTRRCWSDAWSNDKANGAENLGHTSPVDHYPPNMWGLHDMIGNVWEWCEDLYVSDLEQLPHGGASYISSFNDAGRIPSHPPVRVQRGGAFTSSPRRLRCANRNWEIPSVGDNNVGFRLARWLDM